MDKKSAIKLIRETFENSFEKERFVYFVKNLFNKISLEPFEYHGQYIPDTYEPYINKYERVGKYVSEDKRIDILIVYLKKETSIERARTMQRNFIAGYLAGKYGSVKEKDAAVVAFVSPELDDWRFSLVKKEYKLTQTKSGKPKGEEEFTPARRYSFLVGKNEPNHTAQQQLLPILQDDVNNPTLEQLEKAFSVEKITKEFLSQYLSLYQKLNNTIETIVKNDNNVKEEFENKKIKTSDFSKKLLGQIVFLYFLQKKGWLGVPKDKNWGEGDRNFLRSLFKKCSEEKKNFFNDYLEVLFYNTLNNPRTNQADSTYSNYFDCKIPFLNGGLFEPVNNYDWQKKDLIIPNELFSNNEKTKEGDIGTGILDVFDRYNFTVQEDEPLEKEVALDPELLGKVFENLIEENLRKGQGAYYTPREIVHYMCQESLINYLATECEGKVKKEDIEILIKYGDITIEHDKLVIARIEENPEYNGKYKKIKMPESIKNNAKLIDEKLENIRVCDPAVGSGAFPVGMMLEIVKARNILTNFLSNQEGRTSYNFKRHCIENCIYGVDIDSSAIDIAKLRFWLSLIVDEDDVTKIKPLPNLDYKLVCGNSLLGLPENILPNNNINERIEEKKKLLFSTTSLMEKVKIRDEIQKLFIEQLKFLRTIDHTIGNIEFDFHIYFSEVFREKNGFDIVIANPPYKFLSGKGSPVKELIRKGKRKEAELLEKELADITKRFPESSKGCKDLYKWFIQLGTQIIKEKGIITYITPNTYITLSKYADIRDIIINKFHNIIIVDLGFNIFEEPIVATAIFISQKLKSENKYVNYSDIKMIERDLIRKYILRDIINEELVKVEYINGNICFYKNHLAKKIYLNVLKKMKEYCKISEGEHSLDNNFSKIFYKKSKNVLPIIRDDLLNRYCYAKIVYLPKKQCQKYDYNLHNGERIFIRKTGDTILCVPPVKYDFAIAHQNLYVVKSKMNYINIKLLLALFSSKLLSFLYQNGLYGQKNRTLAQFRIYALYSLPIVELEKIDQQPFIDIVDKILEITKDDDYLQNKEKQAKVKEYERQIDQMVYKLYGLTDEEIKIVEGRQ